MFLKGHIKRVMEFFIFLSLSGIIITIGAGVFSRYVLKHSLGWTDELSRTLLIWLVFFGTAVAICERSHVKVDIIVDKLNIRARKAVLVMMDVLTLIFLVFLSIQGYKLVLVTNNTLTPVLRLPLNMAVNAALPVFAVVGVIFMIINIIEDVRG